MANNLFKFQIETHQKQSFTNLDHYLIEAIRDCGVHDGIVLVYCPHTTAAITINENADPDVRVDLKLGLNETFPNRADYVHMEGNSDGHMKASVVGASEMLILANGELILGTWQSVYFAEFDGPRYRTFYVKILDG